MSYGYEETVFRQVLATLIAAQASGKSLSFVAANSIFPSLFPNGEFIANLAAEAMPAIGLEPAAVDEKWFTTGTPPAIQSAFAIDLALVMREGDPSKGLIGDVSTTGLMEFARQVKQVLQADMAAGVQPPMGIAGLQKVLFPRAEYLYEFYPVRICNVKVLLTGQITASSH